MDITTLGVQIDKMQLVLHDDGAIWSRAELLGYLNDAYDDLLSIGRCTTRLTQICVPPRYGFTFCYEWEDAFTDDAPSRMMLWPALTNLYRCTYYWEAEFLEGVTPTESRAGITQDWERSHIADADHHFVYALPHDADLIRVVRWNNKRLNGTSVRDLDSNDSAWFRRVGEPWWWTEGTNRRGTIELYNLRTDYTQAYNPQDFTEGFARYFNGSRTYTVDSSVWTNDYAYATNGDRYTLDHAVPALLTGLGWRFTFASLTTAYDSTQQWELEQVQGTVPTTVGRLRGTFGWERLFGVTLEEFAVGTIRGITSEDRQYFAVGDTTGGIRALQSSEDSVEILHTVVPDVDLGEDDEPGLVPACAMKYLRYGALKRALQHPGPGQNPKIATHYSQREQLGIKFLTKLADLGYYDRVHVRASVDGEDSTRLPYARLPSNYPSVW